MKVPSRKTRTTTADTIENFILESNATLDAPNLVTITGHAHISVGAKLDAPKLRKAHGLTVAAELTFPELETTTGIVEIRGGFLQAPKLTEGDRIELFAGAELSTPQLQTIRTLIIHQSGKLYAKRLRQVTDMLRVHPDASFHNDSLLEVGCCDLGAHATLMAARLAKCADLYVAIGALLHAPIRETGTIYLEVDASVRIEELETIHGDLGIGDGAVFDARNLQVIEGDLSCCANGRFISSNKRPRVAGGTIMDPMAEWTEVAPAAPKVKI